jgi:hypothetical protein
MVGKCITYPFHNVVFVPHGSTAVVDLGHFIIEVSRSHSYIPQSVGLLWASDQPDAETST